MPDKSRAISSQYDGSPSDQEVRASLEVLLNSKAFKASSRNRRFLTYVVDETLAGRGERIKAYSIAVHVFDRAEDFDPLVDPIVRTGAARLRRSIANYYLTAGQDDRIRIDMPTGGYVAAFSYREVANIPISQPARPPDRAVESKNTEPRQHLEPEVSRAISRRTPGRTRVVFPIAAILAATGFILYLVYDLSPARYVASPGDGPFIRVDRIEADPHNAKQSALAHGLTYELVSQLTNRRQLRVYAPEVPTALPFDSQSAPPDYVLSGFLQAGGTIMVQLMDWRSGRIVWASSFHADMSAAGDFDFQVKASEAIADEIVRQVTRQGEMRR